MELFLTLTQQHTKQGTKDTTLTVVLQEVEGLQTYITALRRLDHIGKPKQSRGAEKLRQLSHELGSKKHLHIG